MKIRENRGGTMESRSKYVDAKTVSLRYKVHKSWVICKCISKDTLQGWGESFADSKTKQRLNRILLNYCHVEEEDWFDYSCERDPMPWIEWYCDNSVW